MLLKLTVQKKCLIESKILLKYYNHLGEGILPYKPKELKLNSQVLKKKNKNNLSKLVKKRCSNIRDD